MRLLDLKISLPHWLAFATTPLATLVIGLLLWAAITALVYGLILFIVRRITRHSRTSLDDAIIRIIRKPLVVLLLGYGLLSSWNTAYGDSPATQALQRLYNGLLIVLGASVAWKALYEVVIAYLKPAVQDSDSQADDIIIPILTRIGPVIIVIAVANAVVATLGGNLSTLLASLGLLGIVLGYLFQEPLQGLFSGTYMSLDNPFHEEDLLILEDGTTCQVRKVGVRVTQLYDVKRHVLLFLPNSRLASNKIVNLIKPSVELRTVLPITLKKKDGCKTASALLLEACNGHENILGEFPRKSEAIRRRQQAYRDECDLLLALESPSISDESEVFWLRDHIARLDGELIRLQVDDALRSRSETFSRALLDIFNYLSDLEDSGDLVHRHREVEQRLEESMALFDDLIEQITVWLYMVKIIDAELTDADCEASITDFVERDLLRDGRLTLSELATCRAPGAPTRAIVQRSDLDRIRASDVESDKALDHNSFRDRATYADYRRMYSIWHRNVTHVYRRLVQIHAMQDLDASVPGEVSGRIRELERFFSDAFLLRVSHWQLPYPQLVRVGDDDLQFEITFFIDDVVREHFQRSGRVTTELLMEIERLRAIYEV